MYRPSFTYFLFYMPHYETECANPHSIEQWKIEQINDLISSSIVNVDSIWGLVLQLGKKLWIYRPPLSSSSWAKSSEKPQECEWLKNIARRIDWNNVDLLEIRDELAYIVDSL